MAEHDKNISEVLFYANELNLERATQIKSLKYHEFMKISIGERYVLWHQFESFYNKIKTIESGGKKYKIAYFLKDDNYAEFFEHKEKYKILLDYFYSLLKAYINCADILVTNQQYAALIADSLNRPVFWINDDYAKEQKKSLSEIFKNCKKIMQLPINFNIGKSIRLFLDAEQIKTVASDVEFLNSNPLPEVDII